MTSIRMIALIAVTAAISLPALAQGVSGTWTASFETEVGVQSYTFELVADGDRLTGTASSANGEGEISEGTIDGSQISFVENLNYQGMPLRITYTGTLAGNEIQFTRDVAGLAMEEFVATRPE